MRRATDIAAILPSIKSYDMKPGRQHLSSVRATHAHLLPGLIAIAVIMSAPGWALGGLRVVPSPFVNNSKLIGSAAIAANDIWAVGDIVSNSGLTTTTLAEHFHGTTWSVVPTPTLRAVGVINNSSDSLVEHWDGTSWSVISSPAFTGAGGLNGISADGTNDVWAVGGTAILHWDGAT
jgi:hypothetical protein